MVRTYIKKTDRGQVHEDVFRQAADEVASKQNSLRKAAEKYDINFMTLQRYIKKKSKPKLGKNCTLLGYAKPRQVFSDELEASLSIYLVHCSRIYYGLTPSDVKKLAYEYAKLNNVSFPENWNKFKEASKDWFSSFLKRHSNLSLRSPEATSLGRITSFNKNNVGVFFDNLQSLYQKYKFDGNSVWNVD